MTFRLIALASLGLLLASLSARAGRSRGGDGLKGEYYTNTKHTAENLFEAEPTLTRVDPVIKSLGCMNCGLVDIHILHAGFLFQFIQGTQAHQFRDDGMRQVGVTEQGRNFVLRFHQKLGVNPVIFEAVGRIHRGIFHHHFQNAPGSEVFNILGLDGVALVQKHLPGEIDHVLAQLHPRPQLVESQFKHCPSSHKVSADGPGQLPLIGVKPPKIRRKKRWIPTLCSGSPVFI